MAPRGAIDLSTAFMPHALAAVVHRLARARACSPGGVLGDHVVREFVVRTIHVDERDGTFDGGSLPVDRRGLELIIRVGRWNRHDHGHGGEGMWLDGLEPGVVGDVHIGGEWSGGRERSLSRRAERGSRHSIRRDPR